MQRGAPQNFCNVFELCAPATHGSEHQTHHPNKARRENYHLGKQRGRIIEAKIRLIGTQEKQYGESEKYNTGTCKRSWRQVEGPSKCADQRQDDTRNCR
jgi:hypothetical protein